MPTPPSLRSVAPSAFLPAFVYEIGNGAIAPIMALTAISCGASPGVAAFMLALPPIGQVLGDIPASAMAVRLGDRRAMTLAAGGTFFALIGCFFARSLFVLGPSLLLIGMCTATYYLGRQSYLLEVIPTRLRARAMSTLAGSHRVGLFVGPFVGAAVIALTSLRAAYVVAMVCTLAAVLALVVIPDVERHGESRRRADDDGPSVIALLVARRRMFLTLGTAVFAFSSLRAIRQVVVPLWAVHLGLGAEQTSVIFGIATAVEVTLFYPAGKIMDRFGRLAIAFPAPLIVGVSLMLLPLTHTAVLLTVVAALMSIGNGIGSGIQLTIGADLAPAVGRIRFLSLWRLWADSGNASGPVILSVLASLLSLAAGAVVAGALGIYAAAAMVNWLPKYSPLATSRSIRALRAGQIVADVPPAPPAPT